MSYVDCIPFSCTDSFHTAHNQANQENFILEFPKNTIKPPSSRKGSYKISHDRPSICLSLRPSVTHFSQDLLGIFSYFFAWGYFAISTNKKWLRWISENCICCLGNWVNETNLDQKWNICHFNEGGPIFFCFKLCYIFGYMLLWKLHCSDVSRDFQQEISGQEPKEA